MSAYILSEQETSTLAAYFAAYSGKNAEAAEAMAQALYNFNFDSVNYRYNESTPYETLNFCPQIVSWEEVEAIAGSWLYQSCEHLDTLENTLIFDAVAEFREICKTLEAEEKQRQAAAVQALRKAKPIKWIDYNDSKKIIRQALKEAFPGCKFSLRKRYRTLCVSWGKGPNQAQVEHVIGHFQSTGFDGMRDIEKSYLHIKGGEVFSLSTGYLDISRDYDDKEFQECLEIFKRKFEGSDLPGHFLREKANEYMYKKTQIIEPLPSPTAEAYSYFEYEAPEIEPKAASFAEINAVVQHDKTEAHFNATQSAA